MHKKKPKIGDIWSVKYSDNHKEYYLITDHHNSATFSILNIASGITLAHRFIDWKNPIWQKEV